MGTINKMKKQKVNTINKIIIPKKGNTSLSEETRKKLIQDLQNISTEDLEAIGNKIEENKNKILIEETDFEQIGNPVEIWWKPAFVARKGVKEFVIRWKEKFSDDFVFVWAPVEIWWKLAFAAEKDGKYFLMRWKEKCSDDFDYVERPFDNWWKPASWAEKRVKNGTYHFPIEIS